jgi:hypothetical protein
MRLYVALAVACVLVLPLGAGLAAGQSRPACDQGKASAPQKMEGKVTRVDPAQGRVAVLAADGTTHEFQASKETLQDLKVGDHIEARLRTLPKC